MWTVITLWAAVLLLASLFLAWSHQLPASFVRAVGPGPGLYGVVANPDAWQVYGIVDVLLALLAVAVGAIGLTALNGRATGTAGLWAALAAAVALAFVIHAIAVPPTDGAVIAHRVGTAYQYLHDPAGSGPGETLALIALLLALVGLAGSGLSRT